MNIEDLIEGPLLWVVCLVLGIAVLARLVFFSFKILHDADTGQPGRSSKAAVFGRFLLPFHKAVSKRPLYALLRYAFHFCLFAVPLWFGGHVALWSESRFEWEWSAMPDSWADGMTVAVMVLAVFFLIRRIAWPGVRHGSSLSDYLILFLAALPFYTGYFLTHGTVDDLPFFGEQMRLLHVLSAEAMLLMAAFLFCRTRLDPARCTGCASCELSCPTGTLVSRDEGTRRVFRYSHYQCICCGACVETCPESAAELRHEVSLRRFVQALPSQVIRSVELVRCRTCGALFMPEPLLNKISRTFSEDYLLDCPTCRKTNLADFYRRLSPWRGRVATSLPSSHAPSTRDGRSHPPLSGTGGIGRRSAV